MFHTSAHTNDCVQLRELSSEHALSSNGRDKGLAWRVQYKIQISNRFHVYPSSLLPKLKECSMFPTIPSHEFTYVLLLCSTFCFPGNSLSCVMGQLALFTVLNSLIPQAQSKVDCPATCYILMSMPPIVNGKWLSSFHYMKDISIYKERGFCIYAVSACNKQWYNTFWTQKLCTWIPLNLWKCSIYKMR